MGNRIVFLALIVFMSLNFFMFAPFKVFADDNEQKIGLDCIDIKGAQFTSRPVIDNLPKGKAESVHAKGRYLLKELKKELGSQDVKEVGCQIRDFASGSFLEKEEVPTPLFKDMVDAIMNAEYENAVVNDPFAEQGVYQHRLGVVFSLPDGNKYSLSFLPNRITIDYAESAECAPAGEISYQFFYSSKNYETIRDSMKKICNLPKRKGKKTKKED